VIFEAHSGIPRFPCLLSSKGVLRVNSPLRIGSKISLKLKMENNRISAKLIKPKLKRIPLSNKHYQQSSESYLLGLGVFNFGNLRATGNNKNGSCKG
jgi:hypothetical protein